MKISACLIIKDEEENLPTYIEGVRTIADETIAVDTGSKDKSVKVLEKLKNKYKLNLKIYNFEWINDFAAAKNFAISKASGDWIIFVDADEYFEEKSRKKIRPLLESVLKDKTVLGVTTPYLDVNKITGEIIGSSSQTRIFRNQNDLKYKGAVHEHLAYEGGLNFTFINADFAIIHTGHSPECVKEKIKRNNKIILANKNLAGENYPMYYAYLANALKDEGKLDEAEENAKRAIELMEIDDPFFISAYQIYIEIKKAQNTSVDEMEQILCDALEATARHPDVLAEKFGFNLEHENVPFKDLKSLAIEIIEKANDKELQKKFLNKTEAHLPFVHSILGAIYKAEKDYKNAEKEYLIALKSYKYREDNLRELLSAIEENSEKNSEENYGKAIKILEEYYDINNPTDKEFLSKFFTDKPRDILYKKYANADKNSVDYKLSSGEIIDAVKAAATEVENAKNANLSQEVFKQNLRNKLYLLAICFFFSDAQIIPKVEKELNLLPPSIIAVILRFYGEELPPVEGEIASYNAIMDKAKMYLPKSLREKFLGLKIA